MKIVLATPCYAPDWEWGGVVTWAAQLFPALARRGHEVMVLATRTSGDRAVEEEIQGVKIIRTEGKVLGGSGRVSSETYAATCRKYFAAADVVHLAGVWQPTGHVAARVARSMRVPYGTSPHGALGAYAWTRNRLLKQGYYFLRERGHLAHAAWIHATAPMEQAELEALGWRNTVRVVPNPLDTDLWVPDADEGSAWRRRMGIGGEEFVFLSCGRVHHKKGLDLLPAVLAAVEGNWKWVIIGDDRTGVRAQLESRLRDGDIAKKVIWCDSAPPSDVRAAYSGSDCLLMPSLHENFGNVAVEAAACGCRALVSDAVGSVAWLEEAALPRETEVWKREICRLMASGREETRVRLGRSERIRDLLGSDRVADQFAEAMLQAVAHRRMEH